jgi:hypothetical protein
MRYVHYTDNKVTCYLGNTYYINIHIYSLFIQLTVLTVRGNVNLLGQLRDVDLKPLLHVVEYLSVSLV